MTFDYYAGKTAVITGAASGMGLLTSKTLAAAGGNVVMCDFNEEGVKKAADEINALGKRKAYAVGQKGQTLPYMLYCICLTQARFMW